MSYLAGDGAFLCERFSLATPMLFDAQLDEAVSAYALARGTLAGVCNVAGLPATFSVTDRNLRENVIADVSGAGARHRLLACGLSLALFDTPLVALPTAASAINVRRKRVFLTETTTPFHAALKALLLPDLLVTSEYFGDEHTSGDFVGDVRHEDLQRTSFSDGYFDLIVTSDVLEHVADAVAAEREIIRILRPGGYYCFTVPLNAYAESDRILAEMMSDRTIKYRADPIFHGDPLRPEGALVFRIFSVKEMTARFQNLGTTCVTYHLWSKHYGMIGPGCWVHVVHKPRAEGDRG